MDVSWWRFEDDLDFLRFFLRKVPSFALVESLDVSNCTNLTDLSIEAIAKNCPNLKALDMQSNSFADAALESVADHCPALTSLAIGNGETEGDESNEITNAGIDAIADGCPALTELTLESVGCNNPEFSALAFTENAFPRLTKLVICSVPDINDAALSGIAATSPLLATLEMYPCFCISDAGIEAIAFGCPGLTTLDISGNHGDPEDESITDAAVEAVARGCPAIKTLSFDMCEHLTDESLRHLAACPALTDVDMSIDNLTAAGCEALVDACPSLLSGVFRGRTFALKWPRRSDNPGDGGG